jgi:hypothetical protein
MGSATTIAIKLVIKVAKINGQMPNSPMAGCHFTFETKSHSETSGNWKKCKASRAKTKTIPTVVKIEIAPQKARNACIIVSPTRRFGRKSILRPTLALESGMGYGIELAGISLCIHSPSPLFALHLANFKSSKRAIVLNRVSMPVKRSDEERKQYSPPHSSPSNSANLTQE